MAPTPRKRTVSAKATPVMLSGGNPQIPMGDGDAPVQAYIGALSGWKRDLVQQLDRLIERHVPHVQKAVKWNSPLYGVRGQGWFVGMHVFTQYVKVTFFRATLMQNPPDGGTSEDARWINVREGALDEAQMTAWIVEAASLPGWLMGGKSK